MKAAGIILTLIVLITPLSLHAENISTIRDDEIERYLRNIATPIFAAANLEPDNIRMFIVNSPVLNASVAGGQNMFINTGLILESEDPLLLAGVIAHETGHIAGGHLVRKAEDAEDASMTAVLGSILGIASVAAGAPPEAGAALIHGGQHVATRDFLKHSRSHEEAADQAAIDLLKDVGISPRGLMTLLETLNAQQTMRFGDDINPYIQTHPLSTERITFIRNYLEQSPEYDFPPMKNARIQHQRIMAKLRGFLDKPEKTLSQYPEESITEAYDPHYSHVPARYAQIIAYYRIPDLPKAIARVNQLIRDFPDDPYFHELKGQILFENGHIENAISSYEKAVNLLPDAPLLHLELAIALLAFEEEDRSKDAVTHLQKVVNIEPQNAFAWHQLGIAYGKQNQLGLSYLALAEKASLLREKEDAERLIAMAQKHLPENSPGAIKATDIIKALKDKDNNELF